MTDWSVLTWSHCSRKSNYCLTSSYFMWREDYYKQFEGLVMRSPLRPVAFNLLIESFEEKSLDTAKLKRTTWFWYVDGTFVIWIHGDKELETFLAHLSSRQPSIQFTNRSMNVKNKSPFSTVLFARCKWKWTIRYTKNWRTRIDMFSNNLSPR